MPDCGAEGNIHCERRGKAFHGLAVGPSSDQVGEEDMEEDQQTPPSLERHNHRLDETSRVFSEARSSTDRQSDFCCSAGGSDCME